MTTTTTTATTTFATCCLCFRVTFEVARVEWHLLLLTLSIFSTLAHCSAVGYSYTRFEGPVVGPERLVTVPNAYGGGTHSDYVARPEYSFAYGIEDGKARLLQNRKETRKGDEVRGVYSVVDPDGTLRVVKYTADDANGFQAEVIMNGVARLHGHGSDDYGGSGVANVKQQVQHEQANEVGHEADEDEDEDEDENEHAAEQEEDDYDVDENAAPQKPKDQYMVHEDQGEGAGEDDGEGEGEGEGEGDGDAGGEQEGGGDHEEYEGSSEEGYEDAKTHSQQQEEDNEDSEEY